MSLLRFLTFSYTFNAECVEEDYWFIIDGMVLLCVFLVQFQSVFSPCFSLNAVAQIYLPVSSSSRFKFTAFASSITDIRYSFTFLRTAEKSLNLALCSTLNSKSFEETFRGLEKDHTQWCGWSDFQNAILRRTGKRRTRGTFISDVKNL